MLNPGEPDGLALRDFETGPCAAGRAPGRPHARPGDPTRAYLPRGGGADEPPAFSMQPSPSMYSYLFSRSLFR